LARLKACIERGNKRRRRREEIGGRIFERQLA
jgi:hypothetical protein